jgi:hypothetical protein
MSKKEFTIESDELLIGIEGFTSGRGVDFIMISNCQEMQYG